MLLQRKVVAVIVNVQKNRSEGFGSINVQGESTMLVRFPRQVLLLLVLASGASAEATHRKYVRHWSWTLRSARSLHTSTTPSIAESPSNQPPLNHEDLEMTVAFATEPGLHPPHEVIRTKVDPGSRHQRASTEEDSRSLKAVKIYPGVSTSIPDDGRQFSEDPDAFNQLLFQSNASSVNFQREGTPTDRSARTFNDTVIKGTKVSFLSSVKRENHLVSTAMAGIPRRRLRDVEDDRCHKFEIGDDTKMEFYSPNYPSNYTKNTNCTRILKANKGMVIKLDFRDHFQLENRPTCDFDYLEIRDGQYGFSTLINKFCGRSFPPEIWSTSRYLWLRFHSDESIEDQGFKAIWSMEPRTTAPGVSPEIEPCVIHEDGFPETTFKSEDVVEYREEAFKHGLPLDCLWVVTVKDDWKIHLTFPQYKMAEPNQCDKNFLEVYGEKTDASSRLKHFCGNMADPAKSSTNRIMVRYFIQATATNSSFEAQVTAFRSNKEKPCIEEQEFDCDDDTCINGTLRCNVNVNCPSGKDENEDQQCTSIDGSLLFEQDHVIIIVVVFSLIMFGMCFAFVFNCIRKIIRDHRIIKEHIRQSQEDRLDEIGRKPTPCPISSSRPDLEDRASESSSLEVLPNKELMPPSTLLAHDYSKELVPELNYNMKQMNDIHQSNNVSNAKQERHQESTDEPEMKDSSCQTRESLFDPRLSTSPVQQPTFSTFRCKAPTSTQTHASQTSHPISLLSHQTSTSTSQCSGCSPASRGRDGSMGLCPRHNPGAIPAPPGWSLHEVPDHADYQRIASPKALTRFRSPKFSRQDTTGSGERYGSSTYGSGQPSSSPSSGTTKFPSGDPRYRAEAVIEVDQSRPFSIESTKSAPDVIATH